MTTYRPTVFFGADENSGDKRAEEWAVSRRKHPKVPETVRNTFKLLLEMSMPQVRTLSSRPKFCPKQIHFCFGRFCSISVETSKKHTPQQRVIIGHTGRY